MCPVYSVNSMPGLGPPKQKAKAGRVKATTLPTGEGGPGAPGPGEGGSRAELAPP